VEDVLGRIILDSVTSQDRLLWQGIVHMAGVHTDFLPVGDQG